MPGRARAPLLIVLGAFALQACASRATLAPAPGVQREGKDGAVGSDNGVRVTARVSVWDGPVIRDLTTVTPIQVRIENRSDRPLAIRYGHFSLAAADDRTFSALPPFEIRGTEVVSSTDLRLGSYPYPLDGFVVAPYLAPYYPWMTPYDGAFAYDGYYYDRFHPRWVRVALPTPAMVQRALPEGVLEPNGQAVGFLYFERLDEVRRVTFRYRLINARTDGTFGTITIPFVATD